MTSTEFFCPVCQTTIRVDVEVSGATCDGAGKHRKVEMLPVVDMKVVTVNGEGAPPGE